jgi:outer membrane protein
MRPALAALLALVGGCTGLDPWADYERALPSRTALFSPPEQSGGAPPSPDLRGKTLGIAECIRTALERHPSTRSSWLASRSAAARVGEERGAFLPEVGFSAGASRSDTADFRDSGKSPRNEFTGGFGLRYLLFDGGRRYARLAGAEADLIGENFRHNATLQDLAIAVEVAYGERLAAASLVRVAEDAVRQAQAHVDLAGARLRAGLAARFDVLKAETEKADADLSLVRARSGVRIAQGRLAQTMGIRVDSTFEIEDLPEDARPREREDIRRLLAEASRTRPELRAALANVEARRADVRLARSEFLPTVSIAASYGWRDTEALPDRKEWFAGIGVEVPLFSGFSSTYRVSRAESEAERASSDMDLVLRDVELEVWVAYSRLTEAGEAIGAAEKLVASAEESSRVAEGMYRAGAGSIIELADSLASRTAARTRLVQSRLDWRTALARLERAVGRTLNERRE